MVTELKWRGGKDSSKIVEKTVEQVMEKKQNKLIEGDNVTLTDNADGTTTISSTGGEAEAIPVETIEAFFS